MKTLQNPPPSTRQVSFSPNDFCEFEKPDDKTYKKTCYQKRGGSATPGIQGVSNPTHQQECCNQRIPRYDRRTRPAKILLQKPKRPRQEQFVPLIVGHNHRSTNREIIANTERRSQ